MSYLCQDSEYVVAVRNYITEDRALLSFHKGDIIRLQHMDGLEGGETHTHTHWSTCFFGTCTVCHIGMFFIHSCYLCPFLLCVFREAVRLHCEEESHASGGVKERHY